VIDIHAHFSGGSTPAAVSRCGRRGMAGGRDGRADLPGLPAW
jgi:hypothetical protein